MVTTYQYPYILQVEQMSESIQLPSGGYSESQPIAVEYSICRNENGSGRRLKGVDGEDYASTHKIYCPMGTAPLSQGQVVRVIDLQGVERCRGVVIYSVKDRLNTKIWV